MDFTTGLIHHWRFDDDLRAYIGGADFTDPGGLTYEVGTIQKQLVVPTETAIATPGDVPAANFGAGDSFSIAAWITAKAATYPSLHSLVKKKDGTTGSGSPGWIVYSNSAGGALNAQFLVADGTDRAFLSTAVALPLDTPTLVTCVVDRDADEIRLYGNDTLSDDTPSGDAVGAVGDLSNTEPITIADATLTGGMAIDELRIYSRALSASDIAALYAFRGHKRTPYYTMPGLGLGVM